MQRGSRFPTPTSSRHPERVMKTPPTPLFLIAAANAFVGPRPHGRPNDNRRGRHACPLLLRFLREVNAGSQVTAAEPLGAAPLPGTLHSPHHVGYWSHFDEYVERSSWPLPPVASAGEVGDVRAPNMGYSAGRRWPATSFLLWKPCAPELHQDRRRCARRIGKRGWTERPASSPAS